LVRNKTLPPTTGSRSGDAAITEKRQSIMSPLKLFATVLVAAPLFLAFGLQSWWADFLIAMVAIGAGHGADALFRRARPEPDSNPGPKSLADQRWEIKMLVRKASAAEARGEDDQAIAQFERAIGIAVRPDDAEMVRRQIETVANRTNSARFRTHSWPTSSARAR
jgi:hypothetical protein